MSGSESSEVQELQEKYVIIDRVRKLSGDDVAQKFQGKLIKKLLVRMELQFCRTPDGRRTPNVSEV